MTKLVVAFRNFANARKSEGMIMEGQPFCTSVCCFEPYLPYDYKSNFANLFAFNHIRLLSTHQEMSLLVVR